MVVGGKVGVGQDLLKVGQRHLMVGPLHQRGKQNQVERHGWCDTK